MARVKLQLPATFSFVCQIPVRITDINYGGHVGNDTILTLLHEARMQYLGNLGYSEMNFAGSAMIMSEVAIEFKNELLYGDSVIASVTAGEISKIGFELYYKLEVLRLFDKFRAQVAGKKIIVANAKTAMICYNYEKKKIVAVPEEGLKKLTIGNTQ